MTGFARCGDSYHFDKTEYNWFWEVKSVNNKAIDVKTKLPNWLDGALTQNCKTVIGNYFSRGSFSVYLDLGSVNENSEIKINDELLQKLVVKAIDLYESYGDKLQKPSTTDILSLKGVIDIEDVVLSEDETKSLIDALLNSFENACKDLKIARQAEGEKIKKALMSILDNITDIVCNIDDIAKTQPKKLKQKLQEQINVLLEPTNQLSEERLAQEVVLYVARADIQEEIDRLKAHIKTAQDLLAADGAVGRRLDFLCQELNREANTTCSKSCEIDLTNLGMELKALIEQFREQVQNIE